MKLNGAPCRGSAKLSLCPDPKETQLDRVQVTIEVPGLGAVLITCVRKRDPRWHRRYWSAVRADRLDRP
jgi:hypothetical protein